jgi:hypothetical protein
MRPMLARTFDKGIGYTYQDTCFWWQLVHKDGMILVVDGKIRADVVHEGNLFRGKSVMWHRKR